MKQQRLRTTKPRKLLAAKWTRRAKSRKPRRISRLKAGGGEIAKERADLELSKQKRRSCSQAPPHFTVYGRSR